MPAQRELVAQSGLLWLVVAIGDNIELLQSDDRNSLAFAPCNEIALLRHEGLNSPRRIMLSLISRALRIVSAVPVSLPVGSPTRRRNSSSKSLWIISGECATGCPPSSRIGTCAEWCIRWAIISR